MWSRRPGGSSPGTRTRLLTNELAVVVPPDAPAGFSLDRLLDGRRVATRDGRASRRAGRRLWPPLARARKERGSALSPKVVPFPTVRAVLSAVEAGRVDAGIVYRTDATHVSGARGRARRRAKDHPYLDIVQPAAVIAGPIGSRGAALSRVPESARRPRGVRRSAGFGMPTCDDRRDVGHRAVHRADGA